MWYLTSVALLIVALPISYRLWKMPAWTDRRLRVVNRKLVEELEIKTLEADLLAKLFVNQEAWVDASTATAEHIARVLGVNVREGEVPIDKDYTGTLRSATNGRMRQ